MVRTAISRREKRRKTIGNLEAKAKETCRENTTRKARKRSEDDSKAMGKALLLKTKTRRKLRVRFL